jgi:stage II sporulation protein D
VKKWLLALPLLSLGVWAERPKVSLLRSENTFRHLGWKSRWEWQGAKAALEHMGLQVVVVDEKRIGSGLTTPLLILSNARNLELSTLEAVRRHLAGGGKLLASYQTSYKQADNSSWDPNGFALGPEMGVKFLRWNGTAGDTEALQLAPPYGQIPLARHQAMLVEASPDAFVLAQWDKPEKSPGVVQKGGSIYLGEDLLLPENSHSKQVLGLVAGLLNRLDPKLGLGLPRTPPPLVHPQPPFTPIPVQPGEVRIRVGLGILIPAKGALLLTASKNLLDEKGKPLGRQLRLTMDKDQLWMSLRGKSLPLGPRFSLVGSPYLNCWQENPNGTLRWSAFRGKLELQVAPDGVEGINQLPADSYLAGVIPSEVPFTFPQEALRAMAVVARTYAISHLGRHAGDEYDVCSEVHCQVYRGLSQENPSTSRAVLDTQGELLTFKDKPADTTFHACCGGHGVDVKDTWAESAPLPYLAGTFDQLPASALADLTQEAAFRQWLDSRQPAYCGAAGRFRWEENLPWEQLEAKFKQAIPMLLRPLTPEASPPQLDRLQGVEVVRRDRSGRVAELRLVGSPQDLTLGGDKVRWLTSAGKIGAGGLNSSLFYVDVLGQGEQRVLRIRGGGWGHGVGLCQEGAAGRAQAGQSYRKILDHYYPGTVLKQPELGPPIPGRVFP